MEVKNVICFEIEKEDRIYRLEMPMGAPLGEAYEVASNFLERMIELINENAEKAKLEEKPKEEAEEKAVEEEHPPEAA